ncbi:hypothetical protein GmRootA79_10500 [Acidovorax sp. A79]
MGAPARPDLPSPVGIHVPAQAPSAILALGDIRRKLDAAGNARTLRMAGIRGNN